MTREPKFITNFYLLLMVRQNTIKYLSSLNVYRNNKTNIYFFVTILRYFGGKELKQQKHAQEKSM